MEPGSDANVVARARSAVIDAHVHLWQYSVEEYSWIVDSMSQLRRDFLPKDLSIELARSRINGVVAVQARETLEETRWLLELAKGNDKICGVVGWAPIANESFEKILDVLIAEPGLVGLRHVLQAEEESFFESSDFNRGIRAMRDSGLIYDVLIREEQLEHAIRFIDRHPGQLFVLDHLGKPKIATGQMNPWRINLFDLSKRQNVCCKLSGMVTEASWVDWTRDSLKPYLDTAIEAFGPERVMAGSDWPVCLTAATYDQWWDVLRCYFSDYSDTEQSKIFGETAVNIYGLGNGARP